MSAWRRKALALFPERKREIESNFNFGDFMIEFLSLTHEAHFDRDFEFLKKIYGIAEWALNEDDMDLWNSAGVIFYEHILSVKKQYGQKSSLRYRRMSFMQTAS